MEQRYNSIRTSLVLQGLGLCASTAEGRGLTPGRGTKIRHAKREVPQAKVQSLPQNLPWGPQPATAAQHPL